MNDADAEASEALSHAIRDMGRDWLFCETPPEPHLPLCALLDSRHWGGRYPSLADFPDLIQTFTPPGRRCYPAFVRAPQSPSDGGAGICRRADYVPPYL
jgi:hypothetical protein